MRAVLLLCVVAALALFPGRGRAYEYAGDEDVDTAADGDDTAYLATLTASDLKKILFDRGIEAPTGASMTDLRRLVSKTDDRDEPVMQRPKQDAARAASAPRAAVRDAPVMVKVLYCMS